VSTPTQPADADDGRDDSLGSIVAASIGTTRKRLMVGGPTPLPPEVAAAGGLPVFDERTPMFADLLVRVTDRLRVVFDTANDVLTFTSSATGALESVIQNALSPGDRVLVASNGLFGERLAQMCRAFRLDVVPVARRWGQPLDLDRISEEIAADPGIVAAFAVHCESSTGMVNDVAGFARATADRISVVDAASSLGACELATDDWGIDVVVAASQKALMAPPGLSFISVSPRAWAAAKNSTMPRYFFDWAMARQAFADDARTSFTPAVSLFVQLDCALGLLLAEGLTEVRRRHALLGRLTRIGVVAMGLSAFAPEEWASPTVTTVQLPPGLSGRHVAEWAARVHGIQFAPGSGDLIDRNIRIGHCGHVDVHDIATAVNALELTLAVLGADVPIGAAAAAIQAAIADEIGGRCD
jgi:aspartate aminotransferase-like enzyme